MVALARPPKESSVEGYPSLPTNLIADPFAGNPRGFQPTCEAEEILRDAVGWWDCSSGFKQGDRWLRNRGTGGEALDLRLGSSTAPNSNDPLFLEPEEQGYVYLPGVSGNNMLAPYQSSFNPVSSVEYIIDATGSDWAGAGYRGLIGRDTGGYVGVNFYFYAGRFIINVNSTEIVNVAYGGLAADSRHQIKVVYTVDDGAGKSTIAAYHRAYGESDWTTYANSTLSAKYVPTATTYPISIGYFIGSWVGRIYSAQMTVDGVKVLDIDCDRIKDGATESFPAATGQTVQIVRSYDLNRHCVAMPAKRYGSRACMLTGTDDYLIVPNLRATNNVINLAPLYDSALITPFTVIVAFRAFKSVPSSSLNHLFCRGTGNYANICSNLWANDQYVQFTRRTNNNPGVLSSTYTTLIPGKLSVGGVTNALTNSGTVATAFFDNVFGASDTNQYNYTVASGHFLRVGGAESGFSSLEFYGAAFFNRVLTRREIAVITDYYAKTSVNAYPVQAPDADRKAYLASKLAIDPAHPVLDVMKDAVFAIDAKAYDGASNYVENLGWGGELLNPRLGGTAAADTNDPKWLAPEASGYAYLPGVNGNYLSVPDENALDITGDIDISFGATFDVWPPAGNMYPFGKGTTYYMIIPVTGVPTLYWTDAGGTTRNLTASTAVSVTGGSTLWLRVALDVDDGAGQCAATFYLSVDGATWSQHGTKVTGAFGTTTIQSTTNPVVFGGINSTSQANGAGKYRRFTVKSGIDGTTVLDVNCDVITDGRQTSFLAATGQLVTVNRSTSGRKTVLMPNTTVKVMDEANVYLPGVASNYLSVPDGDALDVVGDLDVRVLCALDDWTPGNFQILLNKGVPTGNQNGYAMYVSNASGGKIVLEWSVTGSSSTKSAQSTVAIPTPDGTACWIRTTLDVDNGSSGWTATFYTSFNGTSWTQLGDPVIGAGVTSIYAGTGELRVGSSASATPYPAIGRFYRAQVYNGIDGTKVLDIDTSLAVAGQSTFTAVTGQTVTINSTANSGLRVNAQKVGAGHATWLFGTDDYMEVQGALQHELLNVQGGDDWTALTVVRQWPTDTGNRYLSKEMSGVPYTGWNVAGWTGNALEISLRQNDSFLKEILTAHFARGPLSVVGQVITRATQLETCITPAVALTSDISTVGSAANTFTFRMGNDQRGNAANVEMQAVLLFRRALTANEIATLTAFYESPGAAFNADIAFNSPYVTFNG